MLNEIPTAQQVREKLSELCHSETEALAKKAGVPFTTLLKIKTGETSNPRLETVRLIFPHLFARKPKKVPA